MIWAPGQTTAMTKIENESFDLALIDISLTDGNGYAVCAAIKAQKADIPVIFVTASGDEYSVVTGLDMGEGARPYDEVDFRGKAALVVGAEGAGLSRLVRSKCDFIAELPMPGGFESLNAGVAAGIAIYEVLRQRRRK